MSTSTPEIWAFSSIIISMMTVVTYFGVMFLLAAAVGYPLAYFLRSIKKIMGGPRNHI